LLGKNTVVIEGIPADVPAGNEKELMEGLIEQFKWNKSQIDISAKENIVRSLARRSAVKKGVRLSSEEMHKLIEQLFSSTNPNYAPDWQPYTRWY
jgi:DNA mismatch repair protein MutL